MQPTQPPHIDLTHATDVVCANPECGNYTFQEVVLMKRISAIVSPTGRDAIVPIPVFACNACGFINKEFLPVTTPNTRPETPEEAPKSSLTLVK